MICTFTKLLKCVVKCYVSHIFQRGLFAFPRPWKLILWSSWPSCNLQGCKMKPSGYIQEPKYAIPFMATRGSLQKRVGPRRRHPCMNAQLYSINKHVYSRVLINRLWMMSPFNICTGNWFIFDSLVWIISRLIVIQNWGNHMVSDSLSIEFQVLGIPHFLSISRVGQ